MSRPEICLTAAQKSEVETLAALLSAAQIADYFGIGRTTFFAMIGRDPEIAERYKRGKARAIGTIAQSLIGKARAGDTTSMIFYLKTQAGWRETMQVETLEVDPGRAGEMEIDLSGMSDAALLELTAAIDARDARLQRNSGALLTHEPLRQDNTDIEA